MSTTRRDFIKTTSAAGAALTAASWSGGLVLPGAVVEQSDSFLKDLCLTALDAARTAGAAYADVRIVNVRDQSVASRGNRVTAISDNETFGVGVRALARGAWGFAASRQLTRQECQRIAAQAVAQAVASGRAIRTPVELAAVEAYPDGEWRSPIRRDPFRVPMEDKIDLLLSANARALSVNRVEFVSSSMLFVRKQTTFASTEGSIIQQTVYRTEPQLTVTAVSSDSTSSQSRTSVEVAPVGLGYEHVETAGLEERAVEWAEEAVAKLSAKSVEAGNYDLILDPTNLFFTIHETIGHPTELDRALGSEANYAGSSFLAPPADVIEQLSYGPEFMNVIGDRTQEGALATVGWDDEGVPADSWPIIRDGVFVDYQTTREQVRWISAQTGVTRSHGCAAASSWDAMQFQRMSNVSLMPGEEDHVLEDLIAATDRGILVKGRGSFSIDQERRSFQFGGQMFYEVRNGQIGSMLRDVAYRGDTLGFWKSMDMLGGPRSYFIGGTTGDSKGQPAQTHAVSHGCPPTRFRQIEVINTAS